MSTPLLQLRDWRAGYLQPVCGPLDLALHAGECVGLAGPNGCGKSTLMAALAGAARTHGGTMLRDASLRITWQPQQAPTVAGLPLCARDLLHAADADTAQLPDWLAERLDQRLDRLSGGQLQLLRVCACLHGDANLVMLDEPTNNLDARSIEWLREHLRRPQPARCLLIVSHDEALLDALCTRRIALP